MRGAELLLITLMVSAIALAAQTIGHGLNIGKSDNTPRKERHVITIDEIRSYKKMLTELTDDELVTEVTTAVIQSQAGERESLYISLAQTECARRGKGVLFTTGYNAALNRDKSPKNKRDSSN